MTFTLSLDPDSTMDGFIKSLLFVCLYVSLSDCQFDIFLRYDGSLVFSDFLQDGNNWNI